MRNGVQSKRGFLRWAICAAIWSGLFLVAGIIQSDELQNSRSTSSMSSTDNSFIEIKVAYLLMAQYINATEEFFALQSPATLSALLSAVSEKHPILSTMIPSMQILLDGIPTVQFNTALKDGDEVDFIPIVAGG